MEGWIGVKLSGKNVSVALCVMMACGCGFSAEFSCCKAKTLTMEKLHFPQVSPNKITLCTPCNYTLILTFSFSIYSNLNTFFNKYSVLVILATF